MKKPIIILLLCILVGCKEKKDEFYMCKIINLTDSSITIRIGGCKWNTPSTDFTLYNSNCKEFTAPNGKTYEIKEKQK